MKRIIVAVVMVMALFAFSVPAFATVVPNAIWVDGQLFGTVVTPTSLPDHGPFQPIFSFADSGLSGQRSIATAGPGDPGFVGGRWQVYAATYTEAGLEKYDDGTGKVNHEMNSWAELQSAIDAGDVTVTKTDTRFVCTLNPQN